MFHRIAGLAFVVVAFGLSVRGEEAKGAKPASPTPQKAAAPAISAEEPMAKAFSLARAADYLDSAAIDWQRTRKCGTCHTDMAYLMARPSLAAVSPAKKEVRDFFEDMVTERWKTQGPRWDAEVVAVAVVLAMNDRLTTGKLHPTTRAALDKTWTLQRPDGGFTWLKCGWPPMESDDHYGVSFAAVGVGLAPEGYAKSPAAVKGMQGIRRYLAANPAPSLHHRAMVLWASLYHDGLMTKAEQTKTLDDLMAIQHADGGWSVASLLVGWTEHKRKDKKEQDLKTSDGYATGFITYLARQAGIAASDPRLRRAADWLKGNQRASGRWFTRSPTSDNKHYLSNYGSAFAVMALDACGEPGTGRELSKQPKAPRDAGVASVPKR